ncbi:MAG: lamin tail domain-containing protein [Chitinophagales bacterium]
MKNIILSCLTLFALFTSAQQSVLRINEVQSKNNLGDTSELGKHSDWFEIYNPGNAAVSLWKCYASDDAGLPTKYQFPILNTITISPHQYLRVWADDTVSGVSFHEPHTPFKFSSSGDFISLYDSALSLIDSFSFGAIGPDSSFGRCPDGGNTFRIFAVPTPGAVNCAPSGIYDYTWPELQIVPNPVENKCVVSFKESVKGRFQLFNSLQVMVVNEYFETTKPIDLSDLQTGWYYAIVTIGDLKFVKSILKN